MKKRISLLLVLALCLGLLPMTASAVVDSSMAPKGRPVLVVKGALDGCCGHMSLNRWDTTFTLRYNVVTGAAVMEFGRENVKLATDEEINNTILEYYDRPNRKQEECFQFEVSTLYHVKRERQVLEGNTYGRCVVERCADGPLTNDLNFRIVKWETEPFVADMDCVNDYWKETNLNFDRHGDPDSWPANEDITGVCPIEIRHAGDPRDDQAVLYVQYSADRGKLLYEHSVGQFSKMEIYWEEDKDPVLSPIPEPTLPQVTIQGNGDFEDLGDGRLKVFPHRNCKIKSAQVNGRPVKVGNDGIIDYQPGDAIVIEIVEEEPEPTQAPAPTAAASSTPGPTASPAPVPTVTPTAAPTPAEKEPGEDTIDDPPKNPPANAASNQCGDALYWRYAGGTLTVYGKGPMYEYDNSWWDAVPWLPYRDAIKTVTIEPGCTHIGAYAFDGHEAIDVVHIPLTVKSIGDASFGGCYYMKDLYFGGTREQWDAIPVGYANTSLRIPTLHCLGDGDAAPITSVGIDPMDAGTALASTQGVEIGGRSIELQAYALQDAMGNQTNYVKVRDVATALDGTAGQFNVDWDDGVDLVTGVPYTTRNGQENSTPYSGNRHYERADAPTKVNGRAVGLSAFVLKDDNGNGSTYYKLRDLGQALGFNVGWSSDKGVFLEPGVPYTAAD